MYNLISIDGGGLLGLIPCEILSFIEEELQQLGDDEDIRLADCFDFFAGTSTGGIMALALSTPNANGRPRISAKELKQLYLTEGEKIFDIDIWQKLSTGFGLRNSKYTNDGLKETMQNYFGDLTLADTLKPGLVTSYDLLEQKSFYFCPHRAFQDDKYNFYIRDAALATSSAPTYFPMAEIHSLSGEPHLCIDGVMFAFNPALAAYAEFRRITKSARASNMMLLSLGTGHQPMQVDIEEAKHWGSIDWGSKFSEIMVDGVKQNTHQQLQQVYADNKHNYFRIDPLINAEKPLTIDCALPANLTIMQNIALSYIEQNEVLLKKITHQLYERSFHPDTQFFYKDIGVQVTPTWREHYPQGVPVTVEKDQYRNINEMLDTASKQFGNRVAFESFGVELSYQTMKTYADSLAYWLQQQYLTKGDRIAVMLPNCLSFPVIFQGALKAGMVAVHVNPLYTATELQHVIEDSQCKMLIIWDGAAHLLENVKCVLPNIIISSISDFFPLHKKILFDFGSRYVKKIIKPYRIKTHCYLRKIVLKNLNCHPFIVAIQPSDLAILQYTGGTTGRSKGAMLSHRNIITNMQQTLSVMNPKIKENVNATQVVTALPLYHIFALVLNYLIGYMLGSHNLLITNPKDIGALINQIKKRKINLVTGVNTLYNAMMDYPDFDKVDWSYLQVASAGGMAVRKTTADNWQRRTQIPITEGYGLTETSPVVSVNNYTITEYNGSVGLPVPATEVMIADERGRPKEMGETGEICVKGPQVMKGYWGISAQVDEDMVDKRWFRTGDIGRINAKGELFIVDRLKDMMIVSGFNVYPNEVEHIIDQLPQVLESACIGVEDERKGERIKAFVVLNTTGTIDDERLRSWCKQHLTPYKIPDEFVIIDELPKSNVGKILRRELKES